MAAMANQSNGYNGGLEREPVAHAACCQGPPISENELLLIFLAMSQLQHPLEFGDVRRQVAMAAAVSVTQSPCLGTREQRRNPAPRLVLSIDVASVQVQSEWRWRCCRLECQTSQHMVGDVSTSDLQGSLVPG